MRGGGGAGGCRVGGGNVEMKWSVQFFLSPPPRGGLRVRVIQGYMDLRIDMRKEYDGGVCVRRRCLFTLPVSCTDDLPVE